MIPVKKTQPAIEPLTLAEAIKQLNESSDGGENDDFIEGLIKAARVTCEARTERTFISSGWLVQFDEFPIVTKDNPFAAIYLYKPPLISVESVKYMNESGVLTTIDPADYVVDTASEPGRVVPAPGKSWPSIQSGAINAVRVAYTAGYGSAATDVPEDLRKWMKLAVGDLYEHRNGSAERPSIPHDFADNLLNPYRMLGV